MQEVSGSIPLSSTKLSLSNANHLKSSSGAQLSCVCHKRQRPTMPNCKPQRANNHGEDARQISLNDRMRIEVSNREFPKRADFQMFTFKVPTPAGDLEFKATPGASIVFLGGNGTGKTRLGWYIENSIGHATNFHRIGAHRSLVMNTQVTAPSYELAVNRLLYGADVANHKHRHGNRWRGKPETMLLNDFDQVVMGLYADQNEVAVQFLQDVEINAATNRPQPKLRTLKTMWEAVLPHRQLIVSANKIKVKPANDDGDEYDAGDMSDGERVIFYLIGQVLLAKQDSLIIVDEPELHLNRSIIAKLWDTIESARKDCAFVYLTHDLEFAVTRQAAQKFALRTYTRTANRVQWDIASVPEDTGIPDEIVTKIVGSRQPILFIEGDLGSLDSAIYRRVYPEFTTIPIGGAQDVIHAVSTFRKHEQLHRLSCAGLIDADSRDADEIRQLEASKIFVLSVSEVENLLLCSAVFKALAKRLLFSDTDIETKLTELKTIVFREAQKHAAEVSLRRSRREIDRRMKCIGLEAKTVEQLSAEFATKVAEINVSAAYNNAFQSLYNAIEANDYDTVLKLFDHKGLLSKAAKLLGQQGRESLEEFVGRALCDKDNAALCEALTAFVPRVTALELAPALAA